MSTLYTDAKQKERITATSDLSLLFWVLLSYRTPMKMQEVVIYRHGPHSTSYFRCPRCATTLESEYMSFCDCCGQSLDWNSCEKARKIYIGFRN